ncbi:LPXTG cell wall anchor domain-containing protein [Enterococcus sp. AZ072]|uniref:LPXTG cell wall anchor domain-containing protein n=1 Tax=unclassified Enterococcus TaxID=2608891 RepID=UPI003D2E12BB
MKKFVGLLIIASFFLTGSASSLAATYNTREKPNEAIEDASIWNRDVGDGIDTFKYENGHWVPFESTSKRRSAAREDYLEKVVAPNKEARKQAEELQQGYIAEVKEDAEVFDHLTEDESMLVAYTDEQGSHQVRIPKVEMPDEIAEPAKFFISENVPEMLPVLATADVAEPVTQSSNQPAAPELKELTYKVENNKVLTKADLLEKVTYEGDKSDISIEISSKMVYAAQNNTAYYHDLNSLLAVTTVDKISVLSEEDALAKGLVSAPNESNQLTKINLSLPGQYTITLKTQTAGVTAVLKVEGKNDTIPEPIPTPTPEPQPLKIEVKDHTYPVEVGKYLDETALLSLATYNGDKSKLKVSIATDYVYVTPNAEVYHIDLHELLSKANLETITVMTEQEAINQGLRLATENNDKGGIDTIDRSLPGKYRVTYTDGQTTVTSVITIGEVKAEQEPITTPVNNTRQTTTAKTYPTTQAKNLPKTGSTSSNVLIVLGIGIAAAAAFIYWKKSTKKA